MFIYYDCGCVEKAGISVITCGEHQLDRIEELEARVVSLEEECTVLRLQVKSP